MRLHGHAMRLGRALTLTAMLVGSGVAYAQSVPQLPPADQAAREAERIQREQDLRREQERQQNLQRTRPPAQIELPAPATPAPAIGGGCRDITRIELLGVTKLPAATKTGLIAPFLNRCLDTSDIERLLGVVTKAYIDRGYATARAYIPGQDLSRGTLQVLVVEGKIARVQFQNGKTRQDRLWTATAFPGVIGEPLNLRDLEQGIDQLNRLQSHNATLDLLPGAQPGESIVLVRDRARLGLRINATLDNYGVDATGRTQGALTFSADSPLGLNDFLTFTRKQSYLPHVPDAKNSSDSNSVFYSVPYGYLTVSGGYSGSRYRTFVQTPLQTLRLTGRSNSGFARADYVFDRQQSGQSAASVNLTVKDSDNFLNGTKLIVSSRTLAVLDLGLTTSFRLGGGFANVSVGYSRGLNAFGALDDAANLPRNAPRAQFDKVTFGAGYNYFFPAFGRTASFSSNLSGQYSVEPLYGTEQYTAGGIFTVRGFYRGFLANDAGFAWRNDAGITLPLTTVLGRPVALRPYVAFDVGGVAGRVAGSPEGLLGGTAAGLTATLGPLVADGFVARRLFAPNAIVKEGTSAFFRLSATF